MQSQPGLDRTTRRLLKAGAKAVCARSGVVDVELTVILAPDAEMERLNERFLQHRGPTDVLSFSLFESGESPAGEVYVGVEQAARQAAELGIPLRAELTRLVIHGTLHLLGHDHPLDETRANSPMWELQETILAQVLP